MLKSKRRLRKIQHIHFVGIGGAGMGGIAHVLSREGYMISGSDLVENKSIKDLKKRGAHIYQGHEAAHIGNADVVVVSSAISSDNVEVVAAKEQHIPVVPRAQMLAEIMRFRYGIAVAGAHGKTTTTSLITSVLTVAGYDPTFVIGGLLNSAGSSAELGESHYLVAEADESDASFLYLHPLVAVITNIDRDHMSTYDGDFLCLQKTFLEFIHKVPFYGTVIVCIDDPVIQQLLPQINRPLITYGFHPDADICASDYRQSTWRSEFTVQVKKGSSFACTVNLPGKHNVLNSLAAIAVGLEEGVELEKIKTALHDFQGIGRRLQVTENVRLGEARVTLVDDYGHHPREIFVTLEAIRAIWPDKKLVMVYQPHRYTRTRDLLDDFAEVLSQVDVLVLLEVYSAGEAPISSADGRALARAIRERRRVEPIFLSQIEQLEETLSPLLTTGDLLLLQGAGNIGQIAAQLAGH